MQLPAAFIQWMNPLSGFQQLLQFGVSTGGGGLLPAMALASQLAPPIPIAACASISVEDGRLLASTILQGRSLNLKQILGSMSGVCLPLFLIIMARLEFGRITSEWSHCRGLDLFLPQS